MERGRDVLAPGYVKDVRNLIVRFTEARLRTLSEFKALWRSLGFSFVHEGCPRNVNPLRFFQILNCIALGFLQPYRSARRAPAAEPSKKLRTADAMADQVSGNQVTKSPEVSEEAACAAAGAVYTLYCLYFTQHSSPRSLIYVTPEDLDALTLFAADAGDHHSSLEAVLCLRRLEAESAFLFGAVPFRERDVFGCTEEEAATQRAVVEKQIGVMKERLFAHLPLEEHLSSDLVEDLGLEHVEALGQRYEAALSALPNPPAPSETTASSETGVGSQREPLFSAPGQLSKIVRDHGGNKKR